MGRVADIVEEKYLDRLPHMLWAGGLCVVAAVMALLVYGSRAVRPVTGPVSRSATVVVFETADCASCDDFRKLIGGPHAQSVFSTRVPLRYFDVTDGQPPKRFKLNGTIDGAPTAVAFDIYGREVARITGLPKSLEAFQAILAPIARRAERDISEEQGATR